MWCVWSLVPLLEFPGEGHKIKSSRSFVYHAKTDLVPLYCCCHAWRRAKKSSVFICVLCKNHLLLNCFVGAKSDLYARVGMSEF